jgi:hypothetical protein
MAPVSTLFLPQTTAFRNLKRQPFRTAALSEFGLNRCVARNGGLLQRFETPNRAL